MKTRKILSATILTLVIAISMIALAGCTVTPRVKEGWFDFSVTYEVQGEISTVKGMLVCEYDGISWALDSGFVRSWKGYIEGLEIEQGYCLPIGTTDDGGKIYLAFGFDPAYFMGDSEIGEREAPTPEVYVSYYNEESGETSIISDETTLREYGVRIIDHRYADPIINN